jgi:hypothetical protein
MVRSFWCDHAAGRIAGRVITVDYPALNEGEAMKKPAFPLASAPRENPASFERKEKKSIKKEEFKSLGT